MAVLWQFYVFVRHHNVRVAYRFQLTKLMLFSVTAKFVHTFFFFNLINVEVQNSTIDKFPLQYPKNLNVTSNLLKTFNLTYA